MSKWRWPGACFARGMDAAKLKEVLTTALPAERVMALARELGVVKRESVIELDELVNVLVLVSRTPAGGRQADVLRFSGARP